ncbi:MAG: hypothetical protein ABL998_12585 [Planctomycetota bacterium]
MSRLPTESFDHYVALGPDRSYDAVAKKYGVSKATVLRHAEKNRWQERLREADAKAREDSNKKAVETLQAVKDRQLKEARILEHRALEALKSLPPEKAAKAATMLQIAWRHELLLLGEPTERTELSVEEITRREIQTLLTFSEEADDFGEGDDGELELEEAAPSVETLPDPNQSPLFPRAPIDPEDDSWIVDHDDDPDPAQ